MSTVTIYQNISPKSLKFERHINHILNRIKTGANKELIYKIRTTGDGKMDLPCILFSGIFSYRNASSLIQHSGFICLDFDKFPDSDTLLTWKDTLEGDEFTYCVFLSPSGNGLKCIIKIPPDKDKHKAYFDALREYYKCPYFDIQCSDVSRVCFESYDPYLTINQNSTIWDKAKNYFVNINRNIGAPVDEQKSAQILLKWWTRKYGLYKGERNANLFRLCASFNDYGISPHYALNIVSAFQSQDFKLNEIENTLNSAYKKKDKFGSLKFTDGKEK